jgi:hypothetical protein
MEPVAPPVVITHDTEPPRLVELGDHTDPRRPRPTASVRHRRRNRQWTIFEIGSSMMSVAPRSLSAGIKTLTSVLGTTVSTA